MSLFIGIRTAAHSDNFIVCVDGRLSIRINDVAYCAADNVRKYVIHNNKLIITFGVDIAMSTFQAHCEKYPNVNTEKIFDMVINELQPYIKQHKSSAWFLGIYEIQLDKRRVFKLHCDNCGKIFKEYNPINYDYFASGVFSEEVNDFIQKEVMDKHINNITNILRDTLNYANTEEVGGTWTVFLLTPNNVKQIATYHSPKINIRRFQYAHGMITGSSVIGSDFYNEGQTAKLTLGMNGNLGDMTLTRTSDGTKILQVYDNATNTTLKRDDIDFLYTSGSNTYMLGNWYYNGKQLPTYEQYFELEKRIAELESKI